MEDIVLLHRKTNKKIHSEFPTFSTCLRQVAFIPKDHFIKVQDEYKLEDTDELFESESASSFLISMLCGLYSPVLGETEVFGQFKNFIEQETKKQNSILCTNPIQKWLNHIFQVVKELRTQHLKHQGPTSYGAFVRSTLKEFDRVTVFGSGHLAQEIAPYLSNKKLVNIKCRDLSTTWSQWNLKSHPFHLSSYKEIHSQTEALVIAAPMSLNCIQKEILRMNESPKIIIDLRRKESLEPEWPLNVHKYISLDDFFDHMKHLESKNNLLREKLLTLAQELANQFHLRCELHPMGWDDICA